ncbi:MAG: MBL fold metallo-hydrolase [Deltaproteobacteria bacterium]|nr:MBL fold metallo-hydrolase [Deltaproteobacteria bacterium]
MLFRQLFDPETSTYTYLLADEATREAVLIDTVLEQFDRDGTLLAELGLTLRYTLETHVHADHVTASARFRDTSGSRVVVAASAGVGNADVQIEDGGSLRFGTHELEARLTPGHTEGCVTFVCAREGMAFTGDALLIRGCGRTDFQQGDAGALFRSVRERIFALPADTLLFPGHDYKGRTVTTVEEERRFNPRLGLDRSESEFEKIMAALDLAYPKRIDVAVPANLKCGEGAAAGQPLPGPSVASVIAEMGRQDVDFAMGEGI